MTRPVLTMREQLEELAAVADWLIGLATFLPNSAWDNVAGLGNSLHITMIHTASFATPLAPLLMSRERITDPHGG
jgi:hypothetical protein